MSFTIGEKTYNIKDLSVLKNFKKENLSIKPYPYIVIKNCLDSVIYDYLSNHYPSDELIAGNITRENYRYQLNVSNTLINPNIDPIWKLFVDYHSSKEFYTEVENVFGKKKLKSFPKLKDKNYNKLPIKKRKHPVKLNLNKNNIVLDCQIGINSPTTKTSSVIRPHTDGRSEIYAGLLYFRHEKDSGRGGDLNILDINQNYKNLNEYKKIVGKRENRFFDDFSDKLRKIETVKYEKNTFILFFNEINAIHEVTPRENNPFSRRLVNIIGEYY